MDKQNKMLVIGLVTGAILVAAGFVLFPISQSGDFLETGESALTLRNPSFEGVYDGQWAAYTNDGPFYNFGYSGDWSTHGTQSLKVSDFTSDWVGITQSAVEVPESAERVLLDANIQEEAQLSVRFSGNGATTLKTTTVPGEKTYRFDIPESYRGRTYTGFAIELKNTDGKDLTSNEIFIDNVRFD